MLILLLASLQCGDMWPGRLACSNQQPPVPRQYHNISLAEVGEPRWAGSLAVQAAQKLSADSRPEVCLLPIPSVLHPLGLGGHKSRNHRNTNLCSRIDCCGFRCLLQYLNGISREIVLLCCEPDMYCRPRTSATHNVQMQQKGSTPCLVAASRVFNSFPSAGSLMWSTSTRCLGQGR